MFLGTFIHNLDPKNRFTIPSKILVNINDNKIIVSKGLDGCLDLWTISEFEKYSQKLLSLSQNKLNTRTLLRQLLANAIELEIDSANRVLVPSILLLEAKIIKEVVIIGVGNKCEIWDAENYKKFKDSSDGILEQLAENLDNESF